MTVATKGTATSVKIFAVIVFASLISLILAEAVQHHDLNLHLPASSSSKARSLSVFYPTSWPYGDYRNCTVDSDYKVLDCTQQEKPFNLFTIDVKFSGKLNRDNWGAQFGGVPRDQSQFWTCHNDGLSLVCKN